MHTVRGRLQRKLFYTKIYPTKYFQRENFAIYGTSSDTNKRSHGRLHVGTCRVNIWDTIATVKVVLLKVSQTHQAEKSA